MKNGDGKKAGRKENIKIENVNRKGGMMYEQHKSDRKGLIVLS